LINWAELPDKIKSTRYPFSPDQLDAEQASSIRPAGAGDWAFTDLIGMIEAVGMQLFSLPAETLAWVLLAKDQ
jgi:hypothetical protein